MALKKKISSCTMRFVLLSWYLLHYLFDIFCTTCLISSTALLVWYMLPYIYCPTCLIISLYAKYNVSRVVSSLVSRKYYHLVLWVLFKFSWAISAIFWQYVDLSRLSFTVEIIVRHCSYCVPAFRISHKQVLLMHFIKNN